MKSKWRNELKIINYITTTERYKVIFWLSVILSLYGGFVLGCSSDNFFDSLLVPLSFPIFNIVFFAIIFFNNINACSIFKKDFPDYVIRLKNKKEYIKTLIRLSAIMFLFHFIIIMLLIIGILLLTTFNNLGLSQYQNYSITNFTYLLFYFIRYTIYGLLITIISTLIFINTNPMITLIVNGIFLLLLLYFGNIVAMQNKFSLLIWSYYSITIYPSFMLEISSSVFMLLILEVITMFLYNFSIGNKKVQVL